MIQTYLPQYVRGKTQDPSFANFANGLGRAVYYELVSNGWYTPERYNNIMSQLSGESGHGTSRLAKTNHNYGGRKLKNGGWMMFKDDADFAKNQVAYIRRRPRMWNAKNIIDFAKAAKSYNYFGADLNRYIKLMQNQTAARSAWESAMKGWGNQVPNKVSLPQNDVNNLDNSTNKTALDYLNDEYRNDTNNMIPAAVLAVTPDEHQLTQSLDDNVVKNNNMPEIGDLFTAALAGQQYLPTPLLGYDNYSQQLPGDAKGKDSAGTYNNPIALDPVVVFPDQQMTRVYNIANSSDAEFINRLKTLDRRSIDNHDGTRSIHLMESADNLAYPLIQDVNGKLVDYRNLPLEKRIKKAIQNNDYLQFATPDDAKYFGEHYKQMFPAYFDVPSFKYGKDSGIHIKPSHRGRFTQYLKSHPGMTAEKAKHSKSAAVRKMATFALNARKWKH